MRILIYLSLIVLANVITASTAPLKIGGLIIPYGTLFIGLTFVMRDMVQNKHGRNQTYLVIILALMVSAITSVLLGDTIWIVVASAITFLVSESLDTEIYTRTNKPLHARVLLSGLFGGAVDSALFVLIGLSPLGAGFLPWEAVPLAILGQYLVKSLLQLIAYLFIKVSFVGK